MEHYLDEHDLAYPTVRHLGMVLTQGINPAETFCEIYEQSFPSKCKVYVGHTGRDVLDAFKKGEIRVLVIVSQLQEGFDHKNVNSCGQSPSVKTLVC